MRILCSLVMVLWLASSALGDILFEEHFSDPDAYDNLSNVQVLSGSLDAKFHHEQDHRLSIQDCGEGVVFKLDPQWTDAQRYPVLYLSFCFRVLSDSANDKFAGLIFYQDGQEVFGLGNDYTSENAAFWGGDGKGITIGDVPVAVGHDIHQIVMRIDFDPDGPETIKVGLDPFCRRSEQRQPNHIWTSYQAELKFDEMRLRSGNDSSICEFDEIRIGTDWASVAVADDRPGEYMDRVMKTAQPAGPSEMIGEAIARFWPSGVDHAAVPASLVLEKPRKSIGAVPADWLLKPQFGTLGDQRYAYLAIPSEVDLYGTGEVTGSLLRNGYKIILSNKDNYGYGKPDQLYQSHPWVLGVRPDGSAFGVIFDCTWISQLDLRAGILFTTSAQAQDFPVIMIEGTDPQEVMVKLASLTGTMPMPPRWAIGYQQCRYSYNPDARVREVVDTFREKRIPCDVLWFDIDYMDGFRVFTFDPQQFPDPKSTNNYLHTLGFKSVWMIDPGVKYDPGYFVYDSGTRSDVWVRDATGKPYVGPVWPGDCVFPDFTCPTVRTWWAGLYKKFMLMGIDGVWNDMNEPAVFKDETNMTMPMDNRHRGGGELKAGTHEQYHNVFGLLMVKASREGILETSPTKRPFVLSRSNFLGGHRYAATWTGDNEACWKHLKWSVPMSLNLSLSGQPFNGPDIGGFVGNATPDLWAHWISMGAFFPFSRAHSAKGTDDQEPWSFGAKTESAARVALQRRYRLMPYLYTTFRTAHEKGLPIMRPVFFADPADMSLRMEDQAFLIGSDLMVIPRWAESLQLPTGTWRSISLLGEDARTDPYQCDLKVRGGAIVPVGPVVQTTEEISRRLPLMLIVVLDGRGQAEGTLYEDAGDGYGYQEGKFCLSRFKASKEGREIMVRCEDQDGRQAFQKRLVTVAVIDADGVRYGFGDIIQGVKVNADSSAENLADSSLLH